MRTPVSLLLIGLGAGTFTVGCLLETVEAPDRGTLLELLDGEDGIHLR